MITLYIKASYMDHFIAYAAGTAEEINREIIELTRKYPHISYKTKKEDK